MEDNCSGKTFKKGELIFKEGITCSRVSLLKEGLVKIHMVGVGGREQILKLVKAPNYIGIPNTVGDKTYHYSATAIEETQVCFIGLDNFKELLHLSKDFAYNIIADFCKNEILHFRNCIHKTQKQSAGLLADALLNFANNIYESHSFTLPLSRQEMADSFGTSRENVSRMLSEFQRDGIIKVDKKEISIVNIKRLELISGLG
ncbi:MAG: Crp/Fnr family transcriptional regulator [Bacteroidales bacterium]|nr:Crp/Fnr family transcriptional regulator [Bacteroidales bacterium]